MELKLERIRLPGALAMSWKIVRDFHAYELMGYGYALREVWAGTAVVLGIRVDGRRCGYLVHGLPDRQGLARIMYLATDPRVRGHGIGAAVLRRLGQTYPGAVFYFEVEDPDFAADGEERRMMEHRIGFYRRSGYTLLDFTLTAGPWRLLCMASDPAAAGEIRRRYARYWGSRVVGDRPGA